VLPKTTLAYDKEGVPLSMADKLSKSQEIWPILIAAGYRKGINKTINSEGEDPINVLNAIRGGGENLNARLQPSTSYKSVQGLSQEDLNKKGASVNPQAFSLLDIGEKLRNGQVVLASTPDPVDQSVKASNRLEGELNSINIRLTSEHTYAVLSVDEAKNTITLYNPFGKNSTHHEGEKNISGQFTLTQDEFARGFSQIDVSAPLRRPNHMTRNTPSPLEELC
jgi:hypothetical protein